MKTEGLVLNEEIVNKGVSALFEDEKTGKYYVVENKQQIIGCIMTTYEWSDWRNAKWIWIQSLYILPEFRRLGVFKYMYEKFKIVVATQKEFCGIRLYVDKSNNIASTVYRKLGMNNQHYELFEWEIKN